MAFDVAGSNLLSADAAQLQSDAEAFAAQVELAIDLLGLRGKDTTLSADGLAAANRFLALQVNYQIETGVDAAIYSSTQRGARRADYKLDSGALVRPGLLEEVAALLATDTTGDTSWGNRGYRVITSLR